jgi:hypothetical protein
VWAGVGYGGARSRTCGFCREMGANRASRAEHGEDAGRCAPLEAYSVGEVDEGENRNKEIAARCVGGVQMLTGTERDIQTFVAEEPWQQSLKNRVFPCTEPRSHRESACRAMATPTSANRVHGFEAHSPTVLGGRHLRNMA